MTGASNLYHQDVGYRPWAGPVNVNPSLQTQGALAQTEALANGGDYLGTTAYNQAANVIDQTGSMVAGRNAAAGGLSAMGQQGPLASERNLQHIAAGGDMDNPYLAKMIEDANARNLNKINSSLSGMGRYGSGGHMDVAAKTMSETANNALGQAYENSQTRRLQANQMLDSATMARLGLQKGALESAGSLYAGGVNQAQGMMSMAPALNDNRYDSFQRVAGIGDYYDQREMNNLNNQIGIWNAEQARPWEQVARYNAIATGSGQLGGTKVAISNQSGTSPGVRALGGAVSGATAGNMILPGGWGAAIGAGIGGLGGYFA